MHNKHIARYNMAICAGTALYYTKNVTYRCYCKVSKRCRANECVVKDETEYIDHFSKNWESAYSRACCYEAHQFSLFTSCVICNRTLGHIIAIGIDGLACQHYCPVCFVVVLKGYHKTSFAIFMLAKTLFANNGVVDDVTNKITHAMAPYTIC